MATPRDPSRVREAKPYGPALDCSLAVAKTALCSTRRRGSRAYGKRGHLYWATEGDISIELRHGTPEALDKSLIFSYTLAMGREQAGRGGYNGHRRNKGILG